MSSTMRIKYGCRALLCTWLTDVVRLTYIADVPSQLVQPYVAHSVKTMIHFMARLL